LSFEDAARALEGQLRGLNINVLVWGPGAGAGHHYAKRVQIREALQQHFFVGQVSFSEDLHNVPEWGADLEPHERELYHLALCDVAVVLDTSKGSGEEIAHFVGTSHAHKLLILTDEQYKGVNSFPASLRKHQNQVFYSDSEYKSCEVVKKAMTRVKLVALAKLLKFSN
jgi:hypothetical protein